MFDTNGIIYPASDHRNLLLPEGGIERIVKMEFKDSSRTIVPLPENETVHWRVSAYAIIENEQRHFLMIRSATSLWHFPGGGVETNEDIFACIQRECSEETGYRVQVKPELYHFNEQFFYHKREKRFYHSLQLFFRATLNEPMPRTEDIASHDISKERAWIDLNTHKLNEIHETVQPIVAKLRQ